MLKLQFNLRHQDIYLVNRGAVVATDSKNYLVAQFNQLTDDWETPLTAIFTDDKHQQPYAVIVGANSELEENECFVPWEVLTDECNVYVSVYCGDLHTTVTAAFKVRKSGYIDGETPPPPSPTVYNTIIQAIEDLKSSKQDKLTAGANITIENGTISAKGGTDNYNDLSNIPVLSIENKQVPLRGKFSLGGFTDNYIQESDTHLLSIKFLYGTYIAFDSIPNDRLKNYWSYMQVRMVGKDFPLSDLYNKYTNDIIWTYDGLNDTPSVVDEVMVVMQIKDVAYRTIQILIGKKFETEFSPFHYECYIREKVGIKEFSDWAVLGNGYTLTQQDKQDIADIVIQKLQGGE